MIFDFFLPRLLCLFVTWNKFYSVFAKVSSDKGVRNPGIKNTQLNKKQVTGKIKDIAAGY